MNYIVIGSSGFGEQVFHQTCQAWDEVKAAVKEAIDSDCHPNDVEIFETKAIKFTLDYIPIVEPAGQ